MSKIECCRDCAPPKRRPGCHGSCLEYLVEKEQYNREKAIRDKQKRIADGLHSQTMDGVRRANRARSRKKDTY